MWHERIENLSKDFLPINCFIMARVMWSKIILDKKLFRKTYPYICNECGEFAHTLNEYCEKCGTANSLRPADKDDYKNQEK